MPVRNLWSPLNASAREFSIFCFGSHGAIHLCYSLVYIRYEYAVLLSQTARTDVHYTRVRNDIGESRHKVLCGFAAQQSSLSVFALRSIRDALGTLLLPTSIRGLGTLTKRDSRSTDLQRAECFTARRRGRAETIGLTTPWGRFLIKTFYNLAHSSGP